MIWLAILLLTTVALAPLARVLLLGGPSRRGRREAAIALHRAQLAELDRDLAEGQIAAAEHAAAVVEVQRRLLATAEQREVAIASTARGPLVFALAVVPAVAFGLYLRVGSPGLPSEPLAARIALEKTLAADAAEAMADAEGHVTATTAPLFRKASQAGLSDAPPAADSRAPAE